MAATAANVMTVAEAVEAVKAELGIDAPDLKGKAAVDAAKAKLLARGRLREQIALICCELGIETGWTETGWSIRAPEAQRRQIEVRARARPQGFSQEKREESHMG